MHCSVFKAHVGSEYEINKYRHLSFFVGCLMMKRKLWFHQVSSVVVVRKIDSWTSTILSLDLCPDFMEGVVGQASFLFQNNFWLFLRV